MREHEGVAHIAHFPGASALPEGDVLLCDVARESADEVVEWLQDLGVHHTGAIVIEEIDTVVSDAAAAAEREAPGRPSDALIWEQLEARAREEGDFTFSFIVFVAIAAVIAGIGVLLDSPILIVGAMVVGPEYGPIAALCVAAARRRGRRALAVLSTLAVGLVAGALTALAATAALRFSGLGPDEYDLSQRQLTAFISQPDGMAAVVAVLAGVVGMLSLTERRSGALVGVLVSVTTIPAVGNIGVASAYRQWNEVSGAAVQLAINVVGLVIAGVVTVLVQARMTRAAPR